MQNPTFVLLPLILVALLSKFNFVFSNKDIVYQKYDSKDRARSIVSPNGIIETSLSDLDDLFFEIIYPEEIRFTFRIKIAKEFGSSFTQSFKNIPLIPAQPYDACSPISNSAQLRGKISLVIRGECSFMTKAINIEKSGAVAIIIADNDPLNHNLIDMVADETNREVNIPAVFLPWKDGYMIKKSIDNNRLKYAAINMPLNLTLRNDAYLLKKAPWTHW